MPQQITAHSIERVKHTPGSGDIHDPVCHQWRGFHRAIGIDVEIPGQLEIRDIVLVNVSQRAESLLIISAPMREPVAWLFVRIDDSFRGYRPGTVTWPGRRSFRFWASAIFLRARSKQKSGEQNAEDAFGLVIKRYFSDHAKAPIALWRLMMVSINTGQDYKSNIQSLQIAWRTHVGF
jgi:hypothetical protein